MLQVERSRSPRVAIKRRAKCLGSGNRSFLLNPGQLHIPATEFCNRSSLNLSSVGRSQLPAATCCGVEYRLASAPVNLPNAKRVPGKLQSRQRAFCSAQTRLFGRLSARPGKFRPTKTPAKHPEVPFAFGSVDRGPLMEKPFAGST